MDRESVFVASIFRASSPARARAAQAHLKRVVHAQKPATHEMFAYRCMVLKDGRDGLGDDDFKVVEDSEDDNEQWAGARILKVLKAEAVMDAVVIVSRWYGGVMLGPIRFTHIEDCAREVCKSFRAKDEMDDCIATLVAHDDTLAKLRTELEELRTPTSKAAETTPMTLAHDETVEDSTFKRVAREEVEQPPSKKRKVESSQDYSGLRKSTDLPKARRLITARESAIKVVQKLIDKAKGDF